MKKKSQEDGAGPAQALASARYRRLATVSIFRTKSIDALIAASEEPEKRLRQDAWVRGA